MSGFRFLRCIPFCFLGGALACVGGESAAPVRAKATAIEPISDATRSVLAGSAIDGGLKVRVRDAANQPLAGVTVAFTVTGGNGTVSPRLVVTDAAGEATTTWTAGTIVGTNLVSATVDGVGAALTFTATGTAGSVASISLSTRRARLLSTDDTFRFTARTLDAYGNESASPPAFTVRDPTLVSVDPDGLIHALRRGATTYVVASAGSLADSLLVIVLAPGQSLCTGVADPVTLAVGQVITDVSGDGFCVHAAQADAEYALVPFYNADIPGAGIQVRSRGEGIVKVGATAPLASLDLFSRAATLSVAPASG
jgi:hypothetical protein